MASHVRALAWIHIVLGILGVAAAIVVLAIFGGIAAIVGASHAEDADVAVPLLGGLGGILFLLLTVITVPGLVAGIGLLQFRPWARILTIVLSSLHLLNVPLGTALGVYGLWVLLNRETEALFGRPVPLRA